MNADSGGRVTSDADVSALINAFRYFNETATNLNLAYQRLEERLGDLSRELEEKDRQLYSRYRELDRVTRYLNSLVESLSAGVVAVDTEGKITIFNRAAAEMLGVNAEAAIGLLYADLLSADGLPHGALQTLLTGPELRGVERMLPGRGLNVVSHTTWVVDSLGERIGVMELFEDVSVARRLEERLEQQKTLSALGEMAASVAHELRNPLSVIGGFAAVLQEELTGDEHLGKMADAIVKGVQDLDKVATNLLFLTRRTAVTAAPVEVKQILGETREALHREAGSAGREVTIELILPRENVGATADPTLLRMILSNLGRNALQAVGDGGRLVLRLTWRMLANRMDIIVSDNGCGIAAENLPRLFSPFFTTRETGTGLGLALVKKAVDLHHGEIAVESEIGKGTRFTVSLPIRQGVEGGDVGEKEE